MFKKLLSMVLIVAMVLTFTACGTKEKSKDDAATTNDSSAGLFAPIAKDKI